MKPPDAKAHILATAALGAITEARWERDDLLSRRSMAGAPDLLRGHAAEMAFSPLARDQVLSLALIVAADDLEAGRAPAGGWDLLLPEPGPDEAARLEVRARVLNLGAVPTLEARAVAEDLERRLRPECAGDHELAARLTGDANLHEILWDDPRLPGGDRARLTMLFSIPRLLERAEALSSHRRPDAVRADVAADPRAPWLRRILGLPLAAGILALGAAPAGGGLSGTEP